ncbi:MOSC domain-containing protein YiiM [Allonocardiopsis opalescens]|uniref:MOSC domain-containing protein YiiM n=1 Tax=Allonocardiopsis opalescens TaxID=1144618 RepID=A0A2T0Q5J7_9ACTN|nr:MOSC domain-containing protein YiiM [Allonocardiopsis opalescens]
MNAGTARPIAAKSGRSGIDKRPVEGPVAISAPGAGRSGVAGDEICDTEHHGGADQAVYAYAREDLDGWERELGTRLPSGAFGENLTTSGLDVCGARVGERWRIGADLLLQVTDPRTPCKTFAAWMERQGWVKTFTRRALPGAYLRVLEAGTIRAGDPVVVEHRPDHEVTVAMVFQALTLRPELLPGLLAADDLTADVRARVLRRVPVELDPA